ncbi:MAG: hypothetical protein ACI9JM_000047 [Halioglobus sp.]|jgi:hypothetical protein
MQLLNLHLCIRSTLVFALGATLASNAHAVKYSGSMGVAPAVTVTDNVCLTEGNKEWDWIGLATPSGSLRAKGKRASFDIGGSVQFNTLTNSQLEKNDCGGSLGGRSQLNPNLRANGSSILIKDWLSVKATGRVDQKEISSAFAGGNDDLNRRGNMNTRYRYSIAPTLSHRIGNSMTGNLRYSYDQLFFSEDVQAESSRQGVSGGINSRGSSQYSWGLSARSTEVVYESTALRPARTNELASGTARLSFKYDRKLQLNGTYGYDFKRASTGRELENDDGGFWTIGIRYSPTRHTNFSIGSGDRYFGKTPRLTASHKMKNNIFNASYKKEITYGRELQDLEDGFIDDFNNNSTINSRSPILDERFSLGWTLVGRRQSLNVQGSWSEQTRSEDGSTSQFQSVAVSYAPQLSATYSISGTIGWDSDKPRVALGASDLDIGNTSETWRANVSLSRYINRNSSVSFSYQFTDRQSSLAVGSYQENRVTMTLSLFI